MRVVGTNADLETLGGRMAHTHHCQVCGVTTAACADDHCQGDTGHFCSVHHPDPQYRHTPAPVPRMNVRVVLDEPKPEQSEK